MRAWIALVVVVVCLLLTGTAMAVGEEATVWFGRALSGFAIVVAGLGAFSIKRQRQLRLRSGASDGIEVAETNRMQAQVFLDVVVVGTVVACVCAVFSSPVNGALVAFFLVVFMLADFGLRIVFAQVRARREA